MNPRSRTRDVGALSGMLETNVVDGSYGPITLCTFPSTGVVSTITVSGEISQEDFKNNQLVGSSPIGPPGISFQQDCYSVATVSWGATQWEPGACAVQGGPFTSTVQAV